MDGHLIGSGLRRAIASTHHAARRRLPYQQCRCLATPTEPPGDFQAAPPIRFSDDANHFSTPPNSGGRQLQQRRGGARYPPPRSRHDSSNSAHDALLRRVRIVPASPSYFTSTPQYTDALLGLAQLQRRHALLPVLPPGAAPRVAWKTLAQYGALVREPVKAARYNRLLALLKRLNYIHPAVLPAEVPAALARYKRAVQPSANAARPLRVDAYGRARAVGRRKSCSAVVHVVEGEGEVLVNGRSLVGYFGRLHDRESAVWALKATQRLDKYNVFAVARGGGTTGQAEAITLGVAKALLAHEPALKPALRRAGVVTRDPRRVERKKPGKLKARKMPAWVKR